MTLPLLTTFDQNSVNRWIAQLGRSLQTRDQEVTRKLTEASAAVATMKAQLPTTVAKITAEHQRLLTSTGQRSGGDNVSSMTNSQLSHFVRRVAFAAIGKQAVVPVQNSLTFTASPLVTNTFLIRPEPVVGNALRICGGGTINSQSGSSRTVEIDVALTNGAAQTVVGSFTVVAGAIVPYWYEIDYAIATEGAPGLATYRLLGFATTAGNITIDANQVVFDDVDLVVTEQAQISTPDVLVSITATYWAVELIGGVE